MQNAQAIELQEPPPRPSVLVERRRNGCAHYKNPALIELLRQPSGRPADSGAGESAGLQEVPRKPVQSVEHGFTITDFDCLRPRPGDPLGARPLGVRLHPPAADIALARAERYCRDDRCGLEWAGLLATEVGKIQSFFSSSEYPVAAPTVASINALVAKLVSLSGDLRRACLVGGRQGTPQANQAVADAIRTLGCRSKVPGEYSYWSDLRALCASLCFYWAVAGAIARDDFATARAVMHTQVTRNGGEEALVSALPLLALGSVDWKVLKGFEERRMPASDFLFSLFKTEVSEKELAQGDDADGLFDRVELLISLEFAHLRLRQIAVSSRPLWFWVPLGRYVCNLGGDGVSGRLATHESLPARHVLLQSGLLGGTPDSAICAAQAIRRVLDTSHRRAA